MTFENSAALSAAALPPEAAVDAETQGIANRAESLRLLRDLVDALEDDDRDLFESRLAQFQRLREDGLFVNLARLTRELHRALKDLNYDQRLNQLAGNELPDACLRLDYVVKLGEDAAHRTLDMVDHGRGLLNELGVCATYLSAAGVDGRATAAAEIARIAGALRNDLSGISQAQEFQDLSGQVIRRVIELVRNIEGALIELLRATNSGQRSPVAPLSGVSSGELAGPAVPGLGRGSNSQQDADALLAELGF